MKTRGITYHPIGIIHSPLKDVEGAPIQPAAARAIRGTVEVEERFIAGLKGLDGFSHIILIYHLHLSKKYSLEVTPFLDDKPHGVFATRAPARPNAIGVSVVKLLNIRENKLLVENLDVIEGTPLLDIKPYVRQFDAAEKTTIGWLSTSTHKIMACKSDARFK